MHEKQYIWIIFTNLWQTIAQHMLLDLNFFVFVSWKPNQSLKTKKLSQTVSRLPLVADMLVVPC